MRAYSLVVIWVLAIASCGDPPLEPAAPATTVDGAAAAFGGDATLVGDSGGATASDGAAKPADGDNGATEADGDAATASETAASDTGACTPDCAAKGKQCGSDGCGGTCGFCASNAICTEFQCKPIGGGDACKALTCDANASCAVGTDGIAKCTCKAGYAGDGTKCVLADCALDNGGCDKNANCTAKKDAAPTCACKPGFDGDGKVCKDIDECDKKTAQCAPHAVCTNNEGSYDCKCDVGFDGDGISGCKDIDECKAGKSNCGSDQVCDNTVGSFVCSCAPGYTKEPNGCKDVDECAEKPCSDKATCKNTPGSYTCTCNTGFAGDGKTCTEVDLCKTVACGANAVCQKGADGKALCVCAPGYLGDGKVCTQAVVDIALTGVFVAPLTAGGGCWDNPVFGSCAKPAKANLDAVAKAFSELQASVGTSGWAGKTTALETALQGLGNSSTARPDAYGDAVLQPAGASFPLKEISDTNVPLWSNAKWSKVFLGPTAVLKITLVDADFALDEEIGTVSLQVDLLSKALAAGPVQVAIPVAIQEKQILAIKLVVTAWKGCGDGKCLAPETEASCKADCATSGPKCGDAKCDTGETPATCPADCKVLAGSCKGMCGKQSAPGGCWCDDYCETAKDCCADKVTYCVFGCKNKCGQKSQETDGKTCWCDELCTKNGDCCKDFKGSCP